MTQVKESLHRRHPQVFSFSAISQGAHYLATVNITFIGGILLTDLALLR